MYSDKSINSINIQRKKVSYLFSEQVLFSQLIQLKTRKTGFLFIF